MKKHFTAVIAFCLLSGSAFAADNRDIESITVLGDSRLAAPMSELATTYTQAHMVSVTTTFGKPEEQEKKIEDGESADLFITADAALIQQLKVKGMVDVYSIGRIASHRETHYSAAVVASENMTAARNFLSFLRSKEARDIFKKNGMSIP